MALGQDLLDFAGQLSTLDTALDGDLGDHTNGITDLDAAVTGSEAWWHGPQADDARNLLSGLADSSGKAKTALSQIKGAAAKLRTEALQIGQALEPLERQHTLLTSQRNVPGMPNFRVGPGTTTGVDDTLTTVQSDIDELTSRWIRVRATHDQTINAAVATLGSIIPPRADFQVGGVPMPTGDALDALFAVVVDGAEPTEADLIALRAWFDTLSLDDVEDWEKVFPDLAAVMKVHILAPGLVLSSETDAVKVSLSDEIKKIGLSISGTGTSTLEKLGDGTHRVTFSLKGDISAKLVKVLKIPLKIGLDGTVSFSYEFPTEDQARAFRKDFLKALTQVPDPFDYLQVEGPVEHVKDSLSLVGDIVTLDVDGALDNGIDVLTPDLVDVDGMLSDYIDGIADVVEGVPLTGATVEGGSTVGLDFEVVGVDVRSATSYDVVTGRETRTLSTTGWLDTANVTADGTPVSPVNVSGQRGWQIQLEGDPGHVPDTAKLKVHTKGDVTGTLDGLLPTDMASVAKSKLDGSLGADVQVELSVPLDRIDDVVKAMATEGDLSGLRDLAEESEVTITANTSSTSTSTTDVLVAEGSISKSETTNNLAIVKPKGELDFHRVN